MDLAFAGNIAAVFWLESEGVSVECRYGLQCKILNLGREASLNCKSVRVECRNGLECKRDFGRMADGEAAPAAGTEKTKLCADRAEEQFQMISSDGKVSSESAGLVVAMAHLDLTVTEEQVRMATRAVLPSTETMFTKEEFVQFLELLQVELPEEEVGREAAGGIGMLGPTQMWGSGAASCENGLVHCASDGVNASGG